ncbi:MAG: hypothetical protein SCK29_12610 [Bacillota bacterium]|nr:hypothetical protein [Bacillota bacterium]MDW7684942.1 hypothetical protein [Bacillota bacterium]
MQEFKLLVSLHAYYGPSWQLDVRGDTLYWVKSINGNVLEEKNKKLKQEEIDTFIKEVEKAGVFSWEDHYMHCCMLDGSTWSVELQAGSRTILSRGTNGYPENWALFCDAFTRLAGLDENSCKTML